MGIEAAYQRVAAEVRSECLRIGRDPESVTLLAVSKTVGIDGVAEAIQAGARDFGENRPDPLTEKAQAFPNVRWHFIGNIQSRRIPAIVSAATLIHSVCDFEHGKKINQAALGLGKVQDILLEVNVSGEESKSGIKAELASELMLGLIPLPALRIRGLMTMAPQGDRARALECFQSLAQLFEELKSQLSAEHAAVFNELSMGMSEDWREALKAGATIVRLGRAIFSPDFSAD